MIKIIVATVAACLLAATPALAERVRTTHTTTTVHTRSSGGGGGGTHTLSRTVHTSHTTVFHGGGSSMMGGMHTRSFTRTTVGGFHGHAYVGHRTVTVLRSFHRNFTAPRRFQFGRAYNRPNGWYAHRWVYGERLPGGWYGRDYWIGDYASFGLIDPPDDGYQWVRSGDDALLVDTDTGEVLQVEYGVFY
jgi:Ni/Co efflux regulator RcnB